LENVRLLGNKGFHSRVIDLPCGGDLMVKNSLLQQGANTDNSDLIAVGTEPKNCKAIGPTNISLINNTIIFDRNHSVEERARNHGPNVLFNWQAPMGKLIVRGNKFVNLENWSYRSKKDNTENIVIPDLSATNTMCETRNACGI